MSVISHFLTDAGRVSTALRRNRPSAPGLPRKWRVLWADELPCQTGVYMRRWGVETPYGSVRLHHWLKSDDTRALHDHPWPFVTIVLRGFYWDLRVNETSGALQAQCLTAGSITIRRANHTHAVVLPAGKDCWTFLVTGPIMRRWGFREYVINTMSRPASLGRWRRSEKYFEKNGPHPCD
jgi:hypothetical protein